VSTQFEQEKVVKRYLYILASLFLLSAFVFNPITQSLTGLWQIIRQEGVLLTDYFYIAGMGATLLNVGLVLLVTMIIVDLAKVRLSGLAFAAIFILIGFSLFGKNIYNILPIYLGVFLYSRYIKEDFKHFFLIAVFATCMAPFAGTNIFGGVIGVLTSIAFGTFYGFVIVPLSQHMMRFHNGYTLYNVGFSAGIFALVIVAFLRTLGLEFQPVNYVSTQYHLPLVMIVLLISSSFLVLSFVFKEHTWQEYRTLVQRPGRAVTDYFMLHHTSAVYFNVGLMGILTILLVLATGVPMNGPTMGGVFTVIGFSAFGKNPKNSVSVVLGVYLMFLITGGQMSTGTVMTMIFVTGLAPVPGQYGFLAGILAGALHYSLMNFSSGWQGAFNLYNNGFVSGIVAGFLINIMDNLRKVD